MCCFLGFGSTPELATDGIVEGGISITDQVIDRGSFCEIAVDLFQLHSVLKGLECGRRRRRIMTPLFQDVPAKDKLFMVETTEDGGFVA